MSDLLVTVPLRRIGGVAGSMEPTVMTRVDAALGLFLGAALNPDSQDQGSQSWKGN